MDTKTSVAKIFRVETYGLVLKAMVLAQKAGGIQGFAEKTGLSRGTLYNSFVSKEGEGISDETLQAIAAGLGLDAAKLHGAIRQKLGLGASELDKLKNQIAHIEKHGPSPDYVRSITPVPETPEIAGDIPILQTSPAGGLSKPRQLSDAIGAVPRALYPGDETAFGIVVEGDSMSPWVNNNDIVIASKAIRLEDGMPCIVCAREGFEMHCDTIKYVTADNGRFKLVPHNPAYRPLWVDVDQVWCYPIVLRIYRDYIRMGIKPMQLPVQKRNVGEETQVFPDYDGPQPAPGAGD